MAVNRGLQDIPGIADLRGIRVSAVLELLDSRASLAFQEPPDLRGLAVTRDTAGLLDSAGTRESPVIQGSLDSPG